MGDVHGRPSRSTMAIVLGVAVLVVIVAVALVPMTRANDGRATTIGFVPYWDQERAFEEVDRYADQLSVVSPWWFAPTADGGVVQQHEEYTDVDLELVRGLQARGKKVVPSVANHHKGAWDFEVVGEILADADRVAAHVRALVDLVLDHGYDGLQLDYENLDRDDAEPYAAFVRDLAAALHEHGRTLAVAVHAKTSPSTGGWAEGHDHELLGRYADEVHLMAYDHHYDGSDPGPPAPLWWVEDVLDHTLSVVPADKVVLGIGLYGYDWSSGDVAEGLTLQEAQGRVRRYHGNLRFDDRAETPRFTYTSADQDHELWFEDARSVAAKLELVVSHELRGAFFWRMGGTTPETWDVVAETLGPPA